MAVRATGSRIHMLMICKTKVPLGLPNNRVLLRAGDLTVAATICHILKRTTGTARSGVDLDPGQSTANLERVVLRLWTKRTTFDLQY